MKAVNNSTTEYMPPPSTQAVNMSLRETEKSIKVDLKRFNLDDCQPMEAKETSTWISLRMYP